MAKLQVFVIFLLLVGYIGKEHESEKNVWFYYFAPEDNKKLLT